MQNSIMQGDCRDILKTVSTESVDFVLTDPPYFVKYCDRSGRTIRNDRYPGRVLDAFHDVRRILKPNKLCVSFYGWNHVDAFSTAWKAAGFSLVGHIVFNKTYASAQSTGARKSPPKQSPPSRCPPS
jgi:DNA modification methylase